MTSTFAVASALALLLAGFPATPAADAGWRAPVDGPVEVVRPYRPPPTPYAAGHRGADLAAEVGDPVRAAGRGVVSFAGRVAGRGVVAVAHADGLRTSYEPVTAQVTAGRPVAPGDVLGTLESSTHCPGPCLHWGLRDAAGYRDPMTLLDGRAAGRVRLLPLGWVRSAGPTASCAGRASPWSGSGRPGSRRPRRAPRPRRG